MKILMKSECGGCGRALGQPGTNLEVIAHVTSPPTDSPLPTADSGAGTAGAAHDLFSRLRMVGRVDSRLSQVHRLCAHGPLPPLHCPRLTLIGTQQLEIGV